MTRALILFVLVMPSVAFGIEKVDLVVVIKSESKLYLKSSAALKKAFLQHKNNKALLISPGAFRKVKKQSS